MRTGYEYVLPYRTPDLYATMAEEDGVVTRVTPYAVIVKYKSGEEVTVELGHRSGKWSGKVIPHEVITKLKVGQKVKAGEAIAYNPLFFTMDTLAGNLSYKPGLLARVILVEDEFTYEDSSEMSEEFAQKMTTKNTEIRDIEVEFDKDVFDLVKVGTVVDHDSILAVLRNSLDEVAANYGSGLEALKDVSSTSPRAKTRGVVSNITAVYNGDVENMSASLQRLVGTSDREHYKKAKDLNRERISGQLPANTRRDGKTLKKNTVLIEISIDVNQTMGIGSKQVIGHQMKSVVSNVWTEKLCTQDGIPYDQKFSYTSYIKRVVESTICTGIVGAYCVDTGKAAWEIYDKD